MLGLLGCFDASDGEPSCSSIQEPIQVSGSVSVPELQRKRASSVPVLIEAYESSSVTVCGDGLARTVSPGARIGQWVMAGPGEFAFELRGDPAQQFEIWALLDDNDNGVCDEGEPNARVLVPTAAALEGVALRLDATACPRSL